MFSVRIVTTDVYQAQPVRGLDVCFNDFRGTDIARVPVVRVYGSTPAGQKTCLHVHGVFPYLYVLYDGTEPIQLFLKQLAASLDKALNVAMGKANSSTQHVYKITMVSGIPFYGYHEGEQQFLKIYMFNPNVIRKAADLLLGGAVLNKVFQPFESHIPYQLQLFIDYNLYGMNMLNLGAVKFRQPGESVEARSLPCHRLSSDADSTVALDDSSRLEDLCTKIWDMENIPVDLLLDSNVERMSTCELEVDAVAADILNRHEVGDKIGSNPGLAALWEEERARQRARGEEPQLTPPDSPEREGVHWTEAEALLQDRLQEIISELEPYINRNDEDEEDVADEYPSMSASQVQVHLPSGQDDSASSQDTMILEEEPVVMVNEASIRKVVSSSQSFWEDDALPAASQAIVASQEKALAQMLLDLAESDSPAASQVASQVAALEEQDSILMGQAQEDDGQTPEEREAAEELEMSQRVWEADKPDQEDKLNSEMEVDDDYITGLDVSWNSSQLVDVGDFKGRLTEEPEEKIPQVDGAADENDEDKSKPKKRLGMKGPVVPAAFSNTFKTAPLKTKRTGERDNIFSAFISDLPHARALFPIEDTTKKPLVPQEQKSQVERKASTSSYGSKDSLSVSVSSGIKQKEASTGKYFLKPVTDLPGLSKDLTKSGTLVKPTAIQEKTNVIGTEKPIFDKNDQKGNSVKPAQTVKTRPKASSKTGHSETPKDPKSKPKLHFSKTLSKDKKGTIYQAQKPQEHSLTKVCHETPSETLSTKKSLSVSESKRKSLEIRPENVKRGKSSEDPYANEHITQSTLDNPLTMTVMRSPERKGYFHIKTGKKEKKSQSVSKSKQIKQKKYEEFDFIAAGNMKAAQAALQASLSQKEPSDVTVRSATPDYERGILHRRDSTDSSSSGELHVGEHRFTYGSKQVSHSFAEELDSGKYSSKTQDELSTGMFKTAKDTESSSAGLQEEFSDTNVSAKLQNLKKDKYHKHSEPRKLPGPVISKSWELRNPLNRSSTYDSNYVYYVPIGTKKNTASLKNKKEKLKLRIKRCKARRPFHYNYRPSYVHGKKADVVDENACSGRVLISDTDRENFDINKIGQEKLILENIGSMLLESTEQVSSHGQVGSFESDLRAKSPSDDFNFESPKGHRETYCASASKTQCSGGIPESAMEGLSHTRDIDLISDQMERVCPPQHTKSDATKMSDPQGEAFSELDADHKVQSALLTENSLLPTVLEQQEVVSDSVEKEDSKKTYPKETCDAYAGGSGSVHVTAYINEKRDSCSLEEPSEICSQNEEAPLPERVKEPERDILIEYTEPTPVKLPDHCDDSDASTLVNQKDVISEKKCASHKRSLKGQGGETKKRPKRPAVDYSPHAFSHIYLLEREKIHTDRRKCESHTSVSLPYEEQSAKPKYKGILKDLSVSLERLQEDTPGFSCLKKSDASELYGNSPGSFSEATISDSSQDSFSLARKKGKAKKLSYHKRLARAFVTKKRSRRKTDSSKFMNALSSLHQATVDQLSEESGSCTERAFSDCDGSGLTSLNHQSVLSSASQSPCGSPKKLAGSSVTEYLSGRETGRGDIGRMASSNLKGIETDKPVLYAIREEVVRIGSSDSNIESDSDSNPPRLKQKPSSLPDIAEKDDISDELRVQSSGAQSPDLFESASSARSSLADSSDNITMIPGSPVFGHADGKIVHTSLPSDNASVCPVQSTAVQLTYPGLTHKKTEVRTIPLDASADTPLSPRHGGFIQNDPPQSQQVEIPCSPRHEEDEVVMFRLSTDPEPHEKKPVSFSCSSVDESDSQLHSDAIEMCGIISVKDCQLSEKKTDADATALTEDITRQPEPDSLSNNTRTIPMSPVVSEPDIGAEDTKKSEVKKEIPDERLTSPSSPEMCVSEQDISPLSPGQKVVETDKSKALELAIPASPVTSEQGIDGTPASPDLSSPVIFSKEQVTIPTSPVIHEHEGGEGAFSTTVAPDVPRPADHDGSRPVGSYEDYVSNPESPANYEQIQSSPKAKTPKQVPEKIPDSPQEKLSVFQGVYEKLNVDTSSGEQIEHSQIKEIGHAINIPQSPVENDTELNAAPASLTVVEPDKTDTVVILTNEAVDETELISDKSASTVPEKMAEKVIPTQPMEDEMNVPYTPLEPNDQVKGSKTESSVEESESPSSPCTCKAITGPAGIPSPVEEIFGNNLNKKEIIVIPTVSEEENADSASPVISSESVLKENEVTLGRKQDALSAENDDTDTRDKEDEVGSNGGINLDYDLDLSVGETKLLEDYKDRIILASPASCELNKSDTVVLQAVTTVEPERSDEQTTVSLSKVRDDSEDLTNSVPQEIRADHLGQNQDDLSLYSQDDTPVSPEMFDTSSAEQVSVASTVVQLVVEQSQVVDLDLPLENSSSIEYSHSVEKFGTPDSTDGKSETTGTGCPIDTRCPSAPVPSADMLNDTPQSPESISENCKEFSQLVIPMEFTGKEIDLEESAVMYRPPLTSSLQAEGQVTSLVPYDDEEVHEPCQGPLIPYSPSSSDSVIEGPASPDTEINMTSTVNSQGKSALTVENEDIEDQHCVSKSQVITEGPRPIHSLEMKRKTFTENESRSSNGGLQIPDGDTDNKLSSLDSSDEELPSYQKCRSQPVHLYEPKDSLSPVFGQRVGEPVESVASDACFSKDITSKKFKHRESDLEEGEIISTDSDDDRYPFGESTNRPENVQSMNAENGSASALSVMSHVSKPVNQIMNQDRRSVPRPNTGGLLTSLPGNKNTSVKLQSIELLKSVPIGSQIHDAECLYSPDSFNTDDSSKMIPPVSCAEDVESRESQVMVRPEKSKETTAPILEAVESTKSTKSWDTSVLDLIGLDKTVSQLLQDDSKSCSSIESGQICDENQDSDVIPADSGTAEVCVSPEIPVTSFKGPKTIPVEAEETTETYEEDSSTKPKDVKGDVGESKNPEKPNSLSYCDEDCLEIFDINNTSLDSDLEQPLSPEIPVQAPPKKPVCIFDDPGIPANHQSHDIPLSPVGSSSSVIWPNEPMSPELESVDSDKPKVIPNEIREAEELDDIAEAQLSGSSVEKNDNNASEEPENKHAAHLAESAGYEYFPDKPFSDTPASPELASHNSPYACKSDFPSVEASLVLIPADLNDDSHTKEIDGSAEKSDVVTKELTVMQGEKDILCDKKKHESHQNSRAIIQEAPCSPNMKSDTSLPTSPVIMDKDIEKVKGSDILNYNDGLPLAKLTDGCEKIEDAASHAKQGEEIFPANYQNENLTPHRSPEICSPDSPQHDSDSATSAEITNISVIQEAPCIIPSEILTVDQDVTTDKGLGLSHLVPIQEPLILEDGASPKETPSSPLPSNEEFSSPVIMPSCISDTDRDQNVNGKDEITPLQESVSCHPDRTSSPEKTPSSPLPSNEEFSTPVIMPSCIPDINTDTNIVTSDEVVQESVSSIPDGAASPEETPSSPLPSSEEFSSPVIMPSCIPDINTNTNVVTSNEVVQESVSCIPDGATSPEETPSSPLPSSEEFSSPVLMPSCIPEKNTDPNLFMSHEVVPESVSCIPDGAASPEETPSSPLPSNEEFSSPVIMPSCIPDISTGTNVDRLDEVVQESASCIPDGAASPEKTPSSPVPSSEEFSSPVIMPLCIQDNIQVDESRSPDHIRSSSSLKAEVLSESADKIQTDCGAYYITSFPESPNQEEKTSVIQDAPASLDSPVELPIKDKKETKHIPSEPVLHKDDEEGSITQSTDEVCTLEVNSLQKPANSPTEIRISEESLISHETGIKLSSPDETPEDIAFGNEPASPNDTPSSPAGACAGPSFPEEIPIDFEDMADDSGPVSPENISYIHKGESPEVLESNDKVTKIIPCDITEKIHTENVLHIVKIPSTPALDATGKSVTSFERNSDKDYDRKDGSPVPVSSGNNLPAHCDTAYIYTLCNAASVYPLSPPPAQSDDCQASPPQTIPGSPIAESCDLNELTVIPDTIKELSDSAVAQHNENKFANKVVPNPIHCDEPDSASANREIKELSAVVKNGAPSAFSNGESDSSRNSNEKKTLSRETNKLTHCVKSSAKCNSEEENLFSQSDDGGPASPAGGVADENLAEMTSFIPLDVSTDTENKDPRLYSLVSDQSVTDDSIFKPIPVTSITESCGRVIDAPGDRLVSQPIPLSPTYTAPPCWDPPTAIPLACNPMDFNTPKDPRLCVSQEEYESSFTYEVHEMGNNPASPDCEPIDLSIKNGDCSDNISNTIPLSPQDTVGIYSSVMTTPINHTAGEKVMSNSEQNNTSASADSSNIVGNRKSAPSTGRDGRNYAEQTDRSDSPPPPASPVSTETSRNVVLIPTEIPPGPTEVLASCGALGLPEQHHTGVFYSSKTDLVEGHSEIPGRLQSVDSPLVCDLPEFESTIAEERSLRHWQKVLLSHQIPGAMNDSQISSSELDILSQMNKDPALKGAAMGNRHIVVTPCILPPSVKSVTRWLEGRQWLKQQKQVKCKNVAADGAADAETKEEAAPCKITQPSSEDTGFSSVIRQHDTGKNTMDKSMDAAKMEEHQDDSSSAEDEPSDIIPPSPESEQKRIGQSRRQSKQKPEFFKTPLQPKRKSSVDIMSPSSTPPLHSTPTGKMPRLDEEDVSCTPIHKTEQQEEVLKSKPRMSRRMSRGPHGALRRVLLSNQTQQLMETPSLRRKTSQIEAPTPNNTHGFKLPTQNVADAKAVHEFQHLTVLSVELHCQTRSDLRPDPEFDAICALFYAIFNDVPAEQGPRHLQGVIIVDPSSSSGDKMTDPAQPSTSTAPSPRQSSQAAQTFLHRAGLPKLTATYVKDEDELLREFLELIRRWDPDILVGFEIQMLSWGFLLQRAAQLNIDLCTRISRTPDVQSSSHFSAEKDEYGSDHMSEIHIAGRIVINLWRILRHEVTLNIYTFENVAYHVLHKRIPLYSYRSLTHWFDHKTHLYRWRTIQHFMTRARGNLEIMEHLDMIGQTSEFARVFGIEFYHVLSRGSQYRVESMMLRLAKPMNFIPISPSVQQRSRMQAPECIPLTMEPESKFYTDPVVVLDFQSLYPSIMIAYNYCFSTCLGKIGHFPKCNDGPFEFGCTSLSLTPKQIKKLGDKVSICPNGVVFVRSHVRKGILPSMVEEILNTRIMVKRSMKQCKGNKTLERLLHARQLGLKLIANVTFGYTSANFSGRMPCVEIGDSIVRKARETLERAIRMVEDTPRWGARVVYGDTDSLFILLKGKSKEQAFKIGYEIVDAVTKDNPKPIKLKFEKVYLPCVLQTKKRYVGYSFETLDQKEPIYDAKGIETVRRDTCSAVSKVLERSIKLLFEQHDVSQVRDYVQQQCRKLMEGTVSMQDCIFAKEYRGMAGYKPGACVPALTIARKRISSDRRGEPRVGERVPYVIVYGTPGLPLIQLVREPGEVLADPSLRINATYYITKQVLPPLERIFSLMGVNVFDWYARLPRVVQVIPTAQLQTDNRKGTISSFFSSVHCPVCEELTKRGVCDKCRSDPQLVVVTLNAQIRHWEQTLHNISQICMSCTGTRDVEMKCISKDCPVMFRRNRALKDVSRTAQLRQALQCLE